MPWPSNDTRPHHERHPLDQKPPKGFKNVYLDVDKDGDRIYATVRAGYGEGARCARARRDYARFTAQARAEAAFVERMRGGPMPEWPEAAG